MLNTVALSHALQDSQLSLETRLALVLINHNYGIDDLKNLTELPKNIQWIAFEKPFIKTFNKYHQGQLFQQLNLNEIEKALVNMA